MDAVKFLQERNRMYKSGAATPSIGLEDDYDPVSAVEVVKKWSAAHPRKTRQSVFLEQYPQADIDNTGLTPQACAEAREAGKVLSSCDISFGRIAELLTADRDGRVVVLPCKVGDKLYRVFDGNISEHEVQNMKYFARQRRLGIDMTPFFPDAGRFIGKTVFLTHEEAEKALEGMK